MGKPKVTINKSTKSNPGICLEIFKKPWNLKDTLREK